MVTFFDHYISHDRILPSRKQNRGIAIFGNFVRGGNYGDDAAFIAFRQLMERLSVEANVIPFTNAEQKEALLCEQMAAVSASQLKMAERCINLGLVIGGGIITQHGRVSVQALMPPYEQHLHCPIAYLGSSVDREERYSETDIQSITSSIKRACFFGTRTPWEKAFLSKLVPESAPEVAYDIVYWLQSGRSHIDLPFKKTIGINVRGDLEDGMRTFYAKLADALVKKYDADILFIPFTYSSDPWDDAIASQDIIGRMTSRGRGHMVTSYLGPCMVQEIIGKLDFAIMTRLHAGIFAANTGVPFCCIGYHAKIKGWLDSIERPDLLLCEGKRMEEGAYAYRFPPGAIPSEEEMLEKIDRAMRRPVAPEEIDKRRRVFLDHLMRLLKENGFEFEGISS